MNEDEVEWTDAVVHYLRYHHPEGATIDWYSDELEAGDDWEHGYVQTWFTDRASWTLGPPWLAGELGFDLFWPPDVLMFAQVEPDRTCECGNCETVIDTIGAPASRDVDPVRWDAAMARVSGASMVAPSNAYWVGAPAWTPRAVSQAIEDWCLAHVGKFLQARWAPELGPSPAAKAAADMGARIEAMIKGIEPTYQINGDDEPFRFMVDEATMELLLRGMVEDATDD